MNAIDASYFDSSIPDTEAQITDPRRDVSFRILRLRANSYYLANQRRLFLPCQLVFTVDEASAVKC
jgi:hypothetical protein